MPIADQVFPIGEGIACQMAMTEQLRHTLTVAVDSGRQRPDGSRGELDVLYRAAAGPKEKYRDPSAAHIATRATDPVKYDQMVADFLKKYVD